MGRSMDETPAMGTKQRWDNYVTKWEWDEKGGFRSGRLFGDVVMDYIHTVETKNGKFYPEFCHGWDVDNCKFYDDREDRCPCCALKVKGQHRYYMNVIDLEAEENKPSRPKAEWSPIRYMDISPTLFNRLKELKTVNKGVSISDGEHGANVQVKFNPQLDPGSMYSASMDTKDVAITEDQKTYIVTQKYPDGSSKVVRGKNGLPAQFEYIRCVNSRDDMIKSLRRNGYYGENEQSAAAAHSFDETKTLTKEETVARMAAESPVEEIDLSKVFAGDSTVVDVIAEEEPTPKKGVKKSTGPSDECPTEFGNFANTIECYTKCGVNKECREASEEGSSKEESPSAVEVSTTPAKKKKEVAPVDDDDDTV